MQLKQRFISGIVTGMGSVVLKTGLNILLIPVLLTQLGAEQYGVFVLLIAVLEMALMLDLGFTNGLATLLGEVRGRDDDPEAQRQAAEYLALGHRLYGGLAGLSLLLGVVLIPFFPVVFHFPWALYDVTRLCLGLVLLEAALTLYMGYFRAILMAHCAIYWNNVGETLYFALGNGAGLLMVMSGFGLPGLLVARLFAAALRLVILMKQAARLENHALPRPGLPSRSALTELWTQTGPAFRRLWGMSTHSMVVQVSIYLSHGIDHFVVARFMPLAAVGQYEIVFRFMSMAMNVGTKVCEGLLPLFSRMRNEGRAEPRRLFLKMSRFNVMMTGLILMNIVVFYPELFETFTANRLAIEPTWPLLAVAVPIFMSGSSQLPASYYLYTSGRERFLTRTSIVTALSNVILSLVMVKTMGMVGVALGTLIPQVLQHQGWLIRQAREDLEISLKDYLTQVYGTTLPAWTVALVWALVWRNGLLQGQTSLWEAMLVGGSAALLGALLWLWQAERPFLLGLIHRVRRERREAVPVRVEAVEVPHG